MNENEQINKWIDKHIYKITNTCTVYKWINKWIKSQLFFSSCSLSNYVQSVAWLNADVVSWILFLSVYFQQLRNYAGTYMYVHNIRPWNYVNTYNKMTNPGIASRRVHRGRLPSCTKDYKCYLTKHCHIDLLRNGINSWICLDICTFKTKGTKFNKYLLMHLHQCFTIYNSLSRL